MGSLILATFSSATIALVFKMSTGKKYDEILIAFANYGMASVISLLMMVSDLKYVHEGEVFTFLLGSVTGIFFFLSFYYYQKSVATSGASLAGMFGKLGILVPMGLSIVLWREIPSGYATLGILFSLVSIVIVNWSKNAKVPRYTLILLFFFGGIGEFFNKVFQFYLPSENKSTFLFCVFFSALMVSFVFMRYKKTAINHRALVVGFCVGVPNLLSSFFLIDALQHIKASIVFPFYSAGSIFLIFVLSFILFREKIKPKDQLAMGITILSLVLLNL